MPKTFEEQRNELLNDSSLSVADRQARMLEVSERQAASRGKTPAQLLAECRNPGEIAEVCRACWQTQGDAEIQDDGRARWRREPQVEVVVQSVEGVFRIPANQLERAREIDPSVRVVGNL